MSTPPTVPDIQQDSVKDETKPPRKLSITIPSGSSHPAADTESTTVQDLVDLTSTHTSPTVAPTSPLEMKIGNSRGSRGSEEAQVPQTSASMDLLTDSPPSSSSTISSPLVPEMEAILKCITGMQQLTRTMDSTFEAFGKQTEKVASLAPAVEAAHRLKTLQRDFESQREERKKTIEALQARFKQCIPELIEEHNAMVDDIVKEIVSEEIEIRVRKELENQLPAQLRSDVEQHERQLLEVESKLHNSEARRFNASLASQENLTVPLRPLLIPMPTPEQSPSFIRSPTFTPITAAPDGPLPTPATAFPPSGPRTGLVKSSLFPRDLQTLLGYNAQNARKLLADYGLIDQMEVETPTPTGNGSLQTPTTPATTAKDKAKGEEGKKSKKSAEGDGNREADLTKFMAHIGVPMKMIPNPSLKPGTKPGRPTLRVIITSPTGF